MVLMAAGISCGNVAFPHVPHQKMQRAVLWEQKITGSDSNRRIFDGGGGLAGAWRFRKLAGSHLQASEFERIRIDPDSAVVCGKSPIGARVDHIVTGFLTNLISIPQQLERIHCIFAVKIKPDARSRENIAQNSAQCPSAKGPFNQFHQVAVVEMDGVCPCADLCRSEE